MAKDKDGNWQNSVWSENATRLIGTGDCGFDYYTNTEMTHVYSIGTEPGTKDSLMGDMRYFVNCVLTRPNGPRINCAESFVGFLLKELKKA